MKTGPGFRVLVAAVLAAVLVGGCSTYAIGPSVTYTFDPRFSFNELKTYRWVDAKPVYGGDPLLEANVRFLADRVLAARGLKSAADKVDFVVSVGYEFSSYRNELRTLTLNLARADSNELVWRGMAAGAIKTDASSGDLKNVVEGMLANFPPGAATAASGG
jgi:hypothetical protein